MRLRVQNRRFSFIAGLFLGVWVLFSILLPSQPVLAAPVLSRPEMSVPAISVGITTTVFVTTKVSRDLSDPPLLTDGVNLLRLDTAGKATVLGLMRDDGQDGDATAGDNVFTLRVILNEATVGTLRLRATGAFKGRLQRVRSGVTAVPIVETLLPRANAGPDQTKAVESIVQLDGSGSTDQDGQLLSFAWSFVSRPAGSTTELDAPASVKPSFIIDRAGTYVLQLIVNNGKTDSAADTVEINTTNSKPVANAGPDQTIAVGLPALLDGSAIQRC
jgi:hypothetical protein